MESLEIKQRAINLGKQLVEELRREPDVDLTCRWMAHYIAEQIAILENATGTGKAEAERRCFDTILLLWEHRAVMPYEHRPLESFKPIFRALEALDPENTHPFYHRLRGNRSGTETKVDSVRNLVDFIIGMDSAARILIDSVLKEATKEATDEETKIYLENAIPRNTPDIEVARTLVQRSRDHVTDVETQKEIIRKRLKDKVEKLDNFCVVCKSVRKMFAQQLKELE